MGSFTRYIFFFFTLILTACGKNEFTLNFDLAQDVTDNYNVTYYATDIDGGKTVQAVASVREGKCILNGVTKRPTLIYITPRKAEYPLVVLADRGDKIDISGESKNPLEWKVDGNIINEEITSWRIEYREILLSEDSDSINYAVENFVEENPGNPVSTLLMLSYFQRSSNEREYSSLMASLKGEAKNPHWLDLVARADQRLHAYAYPARLDNMVLRSINQIDTLKINGKNPVFVAFWQTGFPEKGSLVDSLKTLDKDYPDTIKILADICLDIDSTGWRNAIKRDTLENVKRFWAPLGIIDPNMHKLKVTELPYYIVFDSVGTQYYRGGNLSKAIEEYRSLQPAPQVKKK